MRWPCVVLLFGPLVACASKSAGSSGTACNTVVQQGDAVVATRDSQPIPTATGGAISDGTYVLTATTWYSVGGDVFGTSEETLVTTGGTWQLVAATALDGGFVTVVSTAHFSSNGASFTLTQTCPEDAGPPLSGTFSASPTEITLFEPAGPPTVPPQAIELAFTKVN